MSGQYGFDASCVPSKKCCCGQGDLIIEENPRVLSQYGEAPTSTATGFQSLAEIGLTAEFDGGDGCLGLENIAAVFDVDTPSTAIFEYSNIR